MTDTTPSPTYARASWLRPVLTLASGTGIGLGIAYAVRPVLTRLFLPEAFGALGFFVAIASVLSTISTGRYEDALMTPEDDRESAQVLGLSLLLTILLSALAAATLVWRRNLGLWIGKPEITPFLPLIPLALLGLSSARIAESWLTRRGRFGSVSRARILQSGVSSPVQLVGGWMRLEAGGLIGGLVAGQLAAAASLWTRIARLDRPLLAAISPTGIRRVAWRFRRFPQFSVPAALLNTGALHLPALLLFFYFTADVVGFYSQAYGLLAVPIGLLGSAVTQVYFVRSAKAQREGTLGAATGAVYSRLLLLGAFPVLAMSLIGPEVFGFVLGEAFREAGEYARLLAPWLLVLFISSPLTRLYDVLERQRAFLAYNTINFTVRLVALLVGGSLGDARLAIGIYGAAGFFLNLGQLLWLLDLANAPVRTLVRRTIVVLALAAPVLAALLVVRGFHAHPAIVTGAAVLLGLAYLTAARFVERGWS